VNKKSNYPLTVFKQLCFFFVVQKKSTHIMFNLIKFEKDKWQENKNHNSNKYRCTMSMSGKWKSGGFSSSNLTFSI